MTDRSLEPFIWQVSTVGIALLRAFALYASCCNLVGELQCRNEILA